MRNIGFYTKEEVREGLSDYKWVPVLARALLNSGWLPQFKAFNKLRQRDVMNAKRDSALARRQRQGAVM